MVHPTFDKQQQNTLTIAWENIFRLSSSSSIWIFKTKNEGSFVPSLATETWAVSIQLLIPVQRMEIVLSPFLFTIKLGFVSKNMTVLFTLKKALCLPFVLFSQFTLFHHVFSKTFLRTDVRWPLIFCRALISIQQLKIHRLRKTCTHRTSFFPNFSLKFQHKYRDFGTIAYVDNESSERLWSII